MALDNLLSEILGLVPGETPVTVQGNGSSGVLRGIYAGDSMGYVGLASADEKNPWQCAIPEQSIWWIARQKGEPDNEG